MKKLFLVVGLVVLLAGLSAGALQLLKPQTMGFLKGGEQANMANAKVDDFHLLDHEGRSHTLYRQSDSKAVVLISTASDCPMMRQAVPKIKELRDKFGSRGVVFWLLDSSPQAEREGLAREAASLGLDLPVLEDRAQLAASALGLSQTCEAVCVSTTNWMTFYRGAIEPNLANGKAGANGCLENALTRFLAGKTVSPNHVPAKGTPLHLVTAANRPRISYADEVAPVLQKSCVACHTTGGIGPFAMTSYDKVKSRADMIREVLLAQRMPPWHADPHYGSFVNERTLTPEQARTLEQWVEQGAPRGQGNDPLAVTAEQSAPEWPLGRPDVLIKFPRPEEIPASGVFDYRYIYVRSPVSSNAWLRAAVVKPGNRKVVHHILVLVATPQELQNGRLQEGNAGGLEGYFSAYVPGYEAVPYPEGSGKFLPAGSILVFQVHYTASGKPETDQSEMGLYFCKEKPSLELKTRSAFNVKFTIPPGAPNQETVAEFTFKRDALLFEMSPHMHLRGSWFRYEAVYPDGKKEVLLSVPRYDFKWQHLYRLAQPKRLPAGTRLVCTGAHDNSAQNPDNPAPNETVQFGDQTFEEMFIGYFNYTDAPQSHGLARN
jgi:mono/diheme cytochrome c family protein